MTVVRQALVWAGGGALLVATAIDTIAVVGRQVGFALHGAIELIQAAVLVAGAIALVIATLANNHARVRLVVERLGRWRPATERTGEFLTVVFLGAVLAGSVWLSVDMWDSHEVSEVAGVPWRWLRVIANLALTGMIVVLVRGWFRGTAR